MTRLMARQKKKPGIDPTAHADMRDRSVTTPTSIARPRRLRQNMITGAAQMDGVRDWL
jgi:hypothetical protein